MFGKKEGKKKTCFCTWKESYLTPSRVRKRTIIQMEYRSYGGREGAKIRPSSQWIYVFTPSMGEGPALVSLVLVYIPKLCYFMYGLYQESWLRSIYYNSIRKFLILFILSFQFRILFLSFGPSELQRALFGSKNWLYLKHFLLLQVYIIK